MNKLDKLFDNLCTIVFTFDDGSQVKALTTLNTSLLQGYGVADVDGIVDLDTRALIPQEMFKYPFEIIEGVTHELSPLDEIFSAGGKISW